MLLPETHSHLLFNLQLLPLRNFVYTETVVMTHVVLEEKIGEPDRYLS